MIHEYTLKTADTKRQLVDGTGKPLRFMRYLLAESTMKARTKLFVHTQGGPEPLPDDVDLIICTAGINWDVSLNPLDPPVRTAPAPTDTTAQHETPLPTTNAKAKAKAKAKTQTPPATSATPAPTPPKKAPTTMTPSSPALGVACPTCHQQPGLLCTTKDGKPTSPHKLRVAAAAALSATNDDSETAPRSVA